ncbi:DNA polymerase subunit gamma-1-like [Mytilus trossulus]|uniref:DNA polymerase subunit gamma-1-like n=1 Tax=Mytilus trossulus TaxID=6551 RepID=UPI0030058784
MHKIGKASCGCLKSVKIEPDGQKISWCLRKYKYRQSKITSRKDLLHTRNLNQSSAHVRYLHDSSDVNKARLSPINIQMLSEKLHEQIFGKISEKKTSEPVNPETLKKVQYHLESHGLWNKDCPIIPDVQLELPKLLDKDIDKHFLELGKKQTESYRKLAELIIECKMPKCPSKWVMSAGWTKYDSETGKAVPVDFPEEDVCVFDIELVVQEGHYPTMATAVTNKHWYSWCSNRVMEDKNKLATQIWPEDLIPLETSMDQHGPDKSRWRDRLIIGHNVGFDRSFVKEQYYIEKSKLRFLDTMSLHIGVCGQTSFQRILYQASKKGTNRKDVREYLAGKQQKHVQSDDTWKEVSTMNNLNDVYQLHCNGKPLQKDTRDVFVKGTMKDVRERFQELMKYCSADVIATLKVFKVLWPQFLERFPHPVTLAGMMEMGTAYLPINQNWNRYIQQSNSVYDDLQRELKTILMKLANEACTKIHDERYTDDPWLWDLDWSTKDIRIKKAPKTKAKAKKVAEKEETTEDRINRILATSERLYKIRSHMAGYPGWYKDLCMKLNKEDWLPGPSLISLQMRVAPKLMRLMWEGYPVHYDSKLGWGYVVPDPEKLEEDKDMLEKVESDSDGEEKAGEEMSKYPVRSVFKLCGLNYPVKSTRESLFNLEDTLPGYVPQAKVDKNKMAEVVQTGVDGSMTWDEKKKHLQAAGITPRNIPPKEGRHDIGIPGCWFYQIPHKDGKGKNVGNPLAKDYLAKVEDGILKALSGTDANRALKLSIMCSYWKNAMKRIEGQMALGLKKEDLSSNVINSSTYEEDRYYGAIVPRIVSAGTITRRAVEATWLTASNAYPDRVGSELKAMVQAPPGYKFVGADVDSQELWISAIIGDSYAKLHGCTAFGWMTLQGNKADKTDLHSKTAETVGISRDHAKVFNYGRIYGAGQKFAERLLMQFNHRLTPKEAATKAKIMFGTTKGRRIKGGKWAEGTESEMFNRLEDIATSDLPRTPVLGCCISKALEPDNVGDDFMTSRINWVVQSSAVDFLHLMLVCMRWLLDEYDIDGRFAISIHDEVRYLVKEEDQYRAALALHITNLLTRSLFAYKLGMEDLPQSVAFFSAVDIDQCLRKEVTMNCVTPSNPHGMERGYGIQPGQALDIMETLKMTGGLLSTKNLQCVNDSEVEKKQAV